MREKKEKKIGANEMYIHKYFLFFLVEGKPNFTHLIGKFWTFRFQSNVFIEKSMALLFLDLREEYYLIMFLLNFGFLWFQHHFVTNENRMSELLYGKNRDLVLSCNFHSKSFS